MTELELQKAQLRQKYLALRASLDKDLKKRLEADALARLASTDEYLSASMILLYYPIRNEADILPLARLALSQGKRIAFPKCDKSTHTLRFFEVSSLDSLVAGAYGIPEPSEDATALSDTEQALLVVPALLYSRDLYRLGYGAGYYDRFLADFKGISCGFSTEAFVAHSLPRGKFDRRLDMIITEKGVYRLDKQT
jgi:5-formyltetrahydrofolate cyclo-ligase